MKRHCPSAKIVSNAREDFPDPDTPVTTVTRSCGMATETLLRLFWRAPWMRSQSGRGAGRGFTIRHSTATVYGDRHRSRLTASSPSETMTASLRAAARRDGPGGRRAHGVRPGGWMLDRRALVVVPLAAALAGCSGQGGALSPEAERGRQVYAAQCTSCHSSDPAQNGPLGPAVKGSSRELLEAR